MPLHLLPQPLRERDCRIEHGPRQNEKELLSAITSDSVDLPRLRLQELRELLEHRVTGLVPVVVVYSLELVDIADDEGDWLVKPHRMLPHLVQMQFQGAPVFDLGKAIGEGYEPQLVVQLRQLPLPGGEVCLQGFYPQQRINAGFELGKIDRLGDVIVGAGVES